MESLFSLEVIVNFAKLNKPFSSSSCLFPCVAFRLLDYPTIAINLLDEYEASDIKIRLGDVRNEDRPMCFAELLDKHGRFIFSKGKSCLFRADVDSTRAHLQSTPLYLMLLDTFFDPYKLVGTVMVPLKSLIDEICQDIEEQNNFAPSAKSVQRPCVKVTHGVFDIKNLMGEEIGHISLACRLTSYGTSLISHVVPQKRPQEIKDPVKQVEKPKIVIKEESEMTTYELKKSKDVLNKSTKSTITTDALVQTIPIDYKQAQVQISSGKKEKSVEPTIHSDNKNDNVIQIRHVDEEAGLDHYCPPVLKYNVKPTKGFHVIDDQEKVTNLAKIVTEQVYINKRIEYLKNVNEEGDEIESGENRPELVDTEQSVLIMKSKSRQHQSEVSKPHGQLNLSQLPLLSCLFDEISKLKSLIDPSSVSSNSNVANLNTLIQSRRKSIDLVEKKALKEIKNTQNVDNQPLEKIIMKKKPKPQTKKDANKLTGILKKQSKGKEYDKKAIDDIVSRLSQPKSARTPRSARNRSNSPSLLLDYDELPVRGVKDSSSKVKKEPLKYGTTNTFRMRVLANNPKAKEIEKKHEKLMDQVKKNLDELNISSTSDQKSMEKNLEKALQLDSTNSTSILGFRSSLGGTAGRSLSLLNRVDLESTMDTVNYQNMEMSRLLKSNELLSGLNQYEKQLEQSSNVGASTKAVQFGHTYVYTTTEQNDSSSAAASVSNQPTVSPVLPVKARKSIDRQQTGDSTLTSQSMGNSMESSASLPRDKNIFLENKKRASRTSLDYDQEDFLSDSQSSSKHSTSTTSNFFTGLESKLNTGNKYEESDESPRPRARSFDRKVLDDDDDEYDDEFDYLTNTNQSDLKTSSKYSEQSFHSKSFQNDNDESTRY